MFISIICSGARSLVSTSVGVIEFPSRTKPNSEVAGVAIILVVGSDADFCFGVRRLVTYNIVQFLVTVMNTL